MIKFTAFLGNLALSTSLCFAMDSSTPEIIPHTKDLQTEGRDIRKAERAVERVSLEERKAALAEKKAALEKRKADRKEKEKPLDEELVTAFKSQSHLQQIDTIDDFTNKGIALSKEIFDSNNQNQKQANPPSKRQAARKILPFQEEAEDSHTSLGSQRSGENPFMFDIWSMYNEFKKTYGELTKQEFEILYNHSDHNYDSIKRALEDNYTQPPAPSSLPSPEVPGENSPVLLDSQTPDEALDPVVMYDKFKAIYPELTQEAFGDIYLENNCDYTTIKSAINNMYQQGANHPNANAFLGLEESDKSTPAADPVKTYNEFQASFTKMDYKQQAIFLKSFMESLLKEVNDARGENANQVPEQMIPTITFLKEQVETIEKHSELFMNRPSTSKNSLDPTKMGKEFMASFKNCDPTQLLDIMRPINPEFSTLPIGANVANDRSRSQNHKQKDAAEIFLRNQLETFKDQPFHREGVNSHTSLGSPRSGENIDPEMMYHEFKAMYTQLTQEEFENIYLDCECDYEAVKSVLKNKYSQRANHPDTQPFLGFKKVNKSIFKFNPEPSPSYHEYIKYNYNLFNEGLIEVASENQQDVDDVPLERILSSKAVYNKVFSNRLRSTLLPGLKMENHQLSKTIRITLQGLNPVCRQKNQMSEGSDVVDEIVQRQSKINAIQDHLQLLDSPR